MSKFLARRHGISSTGHPGLHGGWSILVMSLIFFVNLGQNQVAIFCCPFFLGNLVDVRPPHASNFWWLLLKMRVTRVIPLGTDGRYWDNNSAEILATDCDAFFRNHCERGMSSQLPWRHLDFIGRVFWTESPEISQEDDLFQEGPVGSHGYVPWL